MFSLSSQFQGLGKSFSQLNNWNTQSYVLFLIFISCDLILFHNECMRQNLKHFAERFCQEQALKLKIIPKMPKADESFFLQYVLPKTIITKYQYCFLRAKKYFSLTVQLSSLEVNAYIVRYIMTEPVPEIWFSVQKVCQRQFKQGICSFFVKFLPYRLIFQSFSEPSAWVPL